MFSKNTWFVLFTLGLLCGVTQAANLTYVCTTGAGQTIGGDLPPAECKDREVRVLNPDGSLKQVIPAPLTPEQRSARDAERKARERKHLEDKAEFDRNQKRLEDDPRWCGRYPEASECRNVPQLPPPSIVHQLEPKEL